MKWRNVWRVVFVSLAVKPGVSYRSLNQGFRQLFRNRTIRPSIQGPGFIGPVRRKLSRCQQMGPDCLGEFG